MMFDFPKRIEGITQWDEVLHHPWFPSAIQQRETSAWPSGFSVTATPHPLQAFISWLILEPFLEGGLTSPSSGLALAHFLSGISSLHLFVSVPQMQLSPG